MVLYSFTDYLRLMQGDKKSFYCTTASVPKIHTWTIIDKAIDFLKETLKQIVTCFYSCIFLKLINLNLLY